MILAPLTFRLGLVLSGSNAGLQMLPTEQKPKPSKGDGASDSDEEEDSDEDEKEEEDSKGGTSKDKPEEDSDEKDEEPKEKPSKGGKSKDEKDEEPSSEDGEEGEGEEGEEDEEDSEESNGSNNGQDDPLTQEEEADEEDGEEDPSEDEEDGDESGSSDDGEGEDDSDDLDEDDSSDGDESVEGGEGSPGEEKGEGEDSDDKPSNSKDGSGDSDPESEAEGEDGDGAGGHASEQAEIEFAKDLLNAIEKGLKTGLIDNNSALGAALKDETTEDLLKNEVAWRPMNPDLDKVVTVPNANQETATAMLQSVKKETAYLTTKLRSKFLASRAQKIMHGVRKGKDLSERRLVDTVVELRSGRRPTRPDWERVPHEECTLAVALVLDESGSMSALRAIVARAALAIAAPLDALGSPCLVVGPRDGDYSGSRYEEAYDGTKQIFHRTDGVVIDVFKDWEEPLRNCLRRFPNVKGTGGTPLEDGIQYAMQELSKRPERHRVILVLTDGMPNNPMVCSYQIRQASGSDIHIIGVALDASCGKGVQKLFPESIVVTDLPQLPNALLGVLDQIMFPKFGGKKIQFDATLSAKKDKK